MKILLVPMLAAMLLNPSGFYVVPRYSAAVSAMLAHLDQCAPDAAQMIRNNVYYIGHSDIDRPFEKYGGEVFLIDVPTDKQALTYFVHEGRHAWQSYRPEFWIDYLHYPADRFAQMHIESDANDYAGLVRSACFP